MDIKWIGSPNFDHNRLTIDRIVIHWMVGTLSSTDAQFQKAGGTSAHYGVEDEKIHQYVSEFDVAYHAGVYNMNQRSIGIEHSAAPDRPASDKTYETSAALIAKIAARHKIPLDRAHVIKHKEVPYATQCCGTVDVDRLISLAKGSPQDPPMDDKNTKKAVQFDQSLIYLKSVKYIESDDSNKYLNGEFLALVKRLYEDRTSNRGRAGEFDKTCRMAGIEGDTNVVTAQQLYEAIAGKDRYQEGYKAGIEAAKQAVDALA